MFKQIPLVDEKEPTPPYYLKVENHFPWKNGRELFIKKVYSVSYDIPCRGIVIMAPGIATNANIFRMNLDGDFLSLDNNRSFANLLASEGFHVYLYHPGYTERVHNRYVTKYCKQSVYFQKHYSIPRTLSFSELINRELPILMDFVKQDSGVKQISWIGYSLGGLIIYSYLSKYRDSSIKNIITIGSPISLTQRFIRIIPYINILSQGLGFEESSFLGIFSNNLVPITRILGIIPLWFIRYNFLTLLLFNPLNMSNESIRRLLGNVIEPIPASLQIHFAELIRRGYSAQKKHSHYLRSLRMLRKTDKHFLFFYGSDDALSPPDSVFLARELINPNDINNLIEVRSTGHIDLICGDHAFDKVWKPSLEWLKARVA
ncbi:MAG: alpha/beta fold hydrolase [Desulfobacterales bacterium]|nr:alpha/beta fold hydrolase [Desulfobacterales bacterium]